MQFQEKLKMLRQKKGLSQAALAKNIYVSRSAIAKWESGLGTPSASNLQALCTFFGVNCRARNGAPARALYHLYGTQERFLVLSAPFAVRIYCGLS